MTDVAFCIKYTDGTMEHGVLDLENPDQRKLLCRCIDAGAIVTLTTYVPTEDEDA